MSDRIGRALAEALRISFDDAAADWFPPVAPTIGGLCADDAARPGPAGTNAPWQVAEHLRIGFDVWGEFLRCGRFDPASFGGGHEWDPIVDPSPERWERACRDLSVSEAAYRSVVETMDDAALLAPNPRLNGDSALNLILSTLAHVGYHAGELATLRPARRLPER